MYQTSGQILLFLLAVTETPTTAGLETMFMRSIDILVLSIIWSIRTLFTLQLRIAKMKKVFCPVKSQISILIWTVLSVSKRILVLVMYFTPPDGTVQPPASLAG